MEVCGLSVLVGKDGREYIIRASDSTFPLMGDTQEDDRRFIADLVVSRMQNVCRPPMAKTVSRSSVSSRGSPTEDMPPLSAGPRPVPTGAPPPIPERSTPGVGSIGRLGSLNSVTDLISEQPSDKAPALANLGRRDSQGLLIFFSCFTENFYQLNIFTPSFSIINCIWCFWCFLKFSSSTKTPTNTNSIISY